MAYVSVRCSARYRILYGHWWARLPPGHFWILADVHWSLQTYMRSTPQAHPPQIQLPARHRMYIWHRSLPCRTCRTVSDPTVPFRTLLYCTGLSRAVLDGTHRTVSYVPDRAAPYRPNVPDQTIPNRIVCSVPYMPYLGLPCRAVLCRHAPYRTGPDRTVPQLP